MPVKERERVEVPSTIRNSDVHAQKLWIKAHNSAIRTYGEGAAAHRVAYAALKHEYKKEGGDHWVRKSKKGPSDPQAARGPTTEHKSTETPRAPTARGRVAGSATEARQKRREASRAYARARASR